MPKVFIARGGTAPYEFGGTTQELFGEDLDGFTDIKISGAVEDAGKKYVVSGQIECIKTFTCDRCLAQAATAQIHRFAEDFDKAEAVDDWLDVTELLRDELLANQPIKNLCKDDCKGLCPKCGANLNEGDCGCDKLCIDPRLAALKNLEIKEV